MKAESGAPSAIHRALARLQFLCGLKVQRFHSDNANEQDSGDIKNSLKKQGTQRTFTASSSSPSNAIVDIRVKSIFAAARAALKVAPPPLNAAEYLSLAALDYIHKASYFPFEAQQPDAAFATHRNSSSRL